MAKKFQQSQHKHGEQSSVSAPMAWVQRWLAGLTESASVLDFACGQGRHARLAADLGCQVLAVDRNQSALDGLEAPIETLCCDLEATPWPFLNRRFDAIVVTNYLFRPRIWMLAAMLKPGGRLIYSTFRLGNEHYGRPSNPAFLLTPGELLRRAGNCGLMVAGFESGLTTDPTPAMVERLCAWRTDGANETFSIDLSTVPGNLVHVG